MKILAIFISFFISVSAFAQKTNEKKVLKICYVSWFGEENINNLGPDYELAKDFAINSGYRPIFIKTSYKTAFDTSKSKNLTNPTLFENNTCNLYGMNITFTTERQKLARLVPVYPGRTFVLLNESTKKITQREDLANLKTVVVAGTNYELILKKLNTSLPDDEKIEIKSTPNPGNLNLLIDKKVDFIIVDAALAFNAIMKYPAKLRLGLPIEKVEQIGWAVETKNTELAKEIGNFLDSQKKIPKSNLNKIFKKYFGLNYSEYEKTIMAVTK